LGPLKLFDFVKLLSDGGRELLIRVSTKLKPRTVDLLLLKRNLVCAKPNLTLGQYEGADADADRDKPASN
jgi:hypothetical protein